MKNLFKILIVGLLALTIVLTQKEPVEAVGVSHEKLVDLLGEEMTAQYLYSELYKKYPETKVFANLADSETRHLNALKRVLPTLGISVEGAKIQDIKIPSTKEEAVAFALAFEKEDIGMLEDLLKIVEDVRLKKVLTNLLKGSNQHAKTLEKAVKEGIDNLSCNGERTYQNRNQKSGNTGKQNQGQSRNTNGAQGKGLGRSNRETSPRGRNRANNQLNCPSNPQ